MLRIYELDVEWSCEDEADKGEAAMIELFRYIESDAFYVDYEKEVAQLDYNAIKRLEFDANSQFLIVFGSKHMSVLDLRYRGIQEPIETFDIDKEYFTKIIDCQMESCVNDFDYERDEDDNSRPNIEHPYRIDLACRQKDEKCVVFFSIEMKDNQKDVDKTRSLNFFDDNEDALDVKISENFE